MAHIKEKVSKAERIKMTIYILPEKRRAIRQYALDHDMTQSTAHELAIDLLLKKA